jgi:chaperonin GroEL (HSP60 family)
MNEAVDGKQNAPTVTAHQINISIAKQVAGLVKSTLGPYGMDKEMVDAAGEVVMTNDGATILKETKLNHPSAKIITEVARTQEENCYDGTTTSVVITGELMDKAQGLLNQKIHPTRIAKGFALANRKAQEILPNMAVDVTDDILKTVASTAMTGKTAEVDGDHLSSVCVEVANATTLDNISIVKRSGGRVSESIAIAGILVDREKSHHNMPDVVEDAKVALIDVDITLPEFAQQVQIQVQDNTAVQEFIESRKDQLHGIAKGITDSGATVILCMRDIDRYIQEYFAKHGVYAARRVARSDLEAVSKSTGARIVSAIDDLTPEDLGTSAKVEEIKVGEKPLIKLTGNKSDAAVSVLIRGPTQSATDEISRAFDDAVGVTTIAIEDGKVVPGGGAPFLFLSKELKEYANSVGGREQLAITAFAEALEVIPSALAENSGLDPLDTLIALRHLHSSESGSVYGVDVEEGGGKNMLEAGVIEPTRVVAQAIESATNIASQLLRIDNIIEMHSAKEIGDDGFNY